MDMNTFTAFVERFGFPVGALVALVFFLYRILIWLGEKIVTPIAASHVALVESTKKTSELNALTLEKIGNVLETKARSIAEITKQNERIVTLTEEIGKLLKEKR